MKRKVYIGVQLCVTVGLFWVIFRGFDWTAFGSLATRLSGRFYAASLAVVLVGQVAYAWRWQVVLRAAGVTVPFRVVLEQFVIGTFLNNFFPSTVGGDVAKVYYLGRDHGYRVVGASIVMDRILGLGILSTLAGVCMWVVPVASPRFAAARLALTGLGVGTCVTLVLVMLGTGGVARRLARFGPRAVSAGEWLQRFRLDMASAVRSPAVWLQAVGLTAAYFVALTLVYAPFIRIETDTAPRFVVLMTVIAATSVLSNIPITINGLGLREQLHVLLLAPLGVSKEAAVAISLLLFAHVLVASLCGGLVWMWRPAADRGARPPVDDPKASLGGGRSPAAPGS